MEDMEQKPRQGASLSEFGVLGRTVSARSSS